MSTPEPMRCRIPACAKPAACRGWCEAHYTRWRRTGNPLPKFGPQQYLTEVVLKYEGDECLPWKFYRTAQGYGEMSYRGRRSIVSRVVCEIANGPPPTPQHHAAHSCGNGHLGCVTKRHLAWKTRLENMADMVVHGTRPHGERHGMAKLSESDVRLIRSLRGAATQRVVAKQFGVSQSTVSRIVAGKSWAP